jgi:hypothetical protein
VNSLQPVPVDKDVPDRSELVEAESV